MQLGEKDGDGDPVGTALTMLRALGHNAIHGAEVQIAKCSDRPQLAEQWTAIVAAMRTIVQVDAHMKVALDLLDTLPMTIAAPQLDSAIIALGLRATPETSHQLARDDASQCEEYYAHCADEHLQRASAMDHLPFKGLHLDIASRYALLRELVSRERTSTD